MKPWKLAEKEVAKYFGGTRRVRVGYNESIGDIIHPKYSIEVKYGKQIPAYLRVNNPTLLTVDGAEYWLEPTKCKGVGIDWVSTKSAKFLERAFEQAERYNPTLEPLVCVKAKGMCGFVVVVRSKMV